MIRFPGTSRLLALAVWTSVAAGLGVLAGGRASLILAAGAVVAGGYAVLRWPGASAVSVDRGVRAAWALTLLVGLIVPALAGLSTLIRLVVNGLSEIEPDGAWLQLAAIGIVVGLGMALALRWPERWPRWTFVVAVGGLALALRLAFVAWVRMEPVSDFLGMWRITGEVDEEGVASVIESTRHIRRLHFERGFLYFLPLRILFGASRWAYAIPNCLATVAASLLTYWMTLRLFGVRAARVSYMLSLLALEPVLAAGIPSHDIPGAVLTVAVLASFLALDRAVGAARWRGATASAIGLGLLLAAVDVQRNNAIFLIGAFVLYLAGGLIVAIFRSREGETTAEGRPGGWRQQAARLVLVLILPVAISSTVTAGLRAGGLRMEKDLLDQWRYRAIAAHSDSWGTGRYGDAVDEYYEHYDLSGAAWRDLAWRKLLTDTVRSPEARLANYFRKATMLFDLGRQMTFYVHDAPVAGGGRLERSDRAVLSFVNRCFVIFFLSIVVLGIARAARDLDTPLEAFVPALYMALFVIAVLLVFQVQPRYMFQIWYVGPMYAGAIFRRSVDGETP